MSTATDISTFLVAAGLSLVEGTNLFVGSEPETPANCVTLYDYGGSSPTQTLSGSTFIHRPKVQVRVRDATYGTGHTLAKAIRDKINDIVHQTISGTRYDGAFQIGGIMHLGKIQTSVGLAHVWTMNFELIEED